MDIVAIDQPAFLASGKIAAAGKMGGMALIKRPALPSGQLVNGLDWIAA
ncbi:hypothetical protein AB4853_40110 [Bradyrhizobium sp. 1050_B9_N1_2]